VERRIKASYNKWLSQGGRFVLVKYFIEAIPIYWMPLVFIPKFVLKKIKKIRLWFLWLGYREKIHIVSFKWMKIDEPKEMGARD
jgi:hypothetical protein